MRGTTVAGVGIGASIVAWQASPALHPLARGLMAFLIGVLPAFSVVQARSVAQLTELPKRNKLYVSTIAGLWVLAVATALVSTEAGMSPRLLGVIELPWTMFLVWVVFGLAGVAAVILVFKAFGVGESRLIHYMIPQTRSEELVYVGVSLTAGICEELIFRGFLIATLTVATGSMPLAVILSAGAFGIAHAHQEAVGALRAALLAVVLTVPLLVTGSLYPGIAAHALVDLLAGLWLSKWLLRS